MTNERSYSRGRITQIAFEAALEMDFPDMALHFIETGKVFITWEMVTKMIARR